jgi:hypothetical protein
MAALIREPTGEEPIGFFDLAASSGKEFSRNRYAGFFDLAASSKRALPGFPGEKSRRNLMISSSPRGSDEPLGIHKYIIPMSPNSPVNTVWNLGRFPIHRPAYALEMIHL